MALKLAQFLVICGFLPFILACPPPDSNTVICSGGTTQTKLSVMTYNLHLFDIASAVTRVPFLKTFLQDLVDTYLSQTDSKLADFRDYERIAHVADRILALSDKPDIIAFTELWSGDLSRNLEDRMREAYPFQYHPDADNYIFDGKVFGNGLALFSKYPIVPGSERFKPFSLLAGFDEFTIKGVGEATIQVCDGPRVGFFLTHTQAIYADVSNSSQVTQNNIREIASVVKQYKTAHPEDAIIIAGDLNISESGPFYGNMLQVLDSTDAFRFYHLDATQFPGFTYDTETNALISLFTDVNPNAPDRERLDYIFFKQGGSITGVSNALDGNPQSPPLGDAFKSTFEFYDPGSSTRYPLSDHYPVRIDFTLKTS